MNDLNNASECEQAERTPNQEFPAVTDSETLPMLDRAQIIDCLREGEVGDGRLFFHLYQNRLRYDHSERKWFYWGGHNWQRDDKALVMKIVSVNLAAQYRLCANDVLKSITPGNDEETKRLASLHKELMARAAQLQYVPRLNHVLTIAEGHMSFEHEWDTTPMIIGTGNGVIDLRTGTLRPGRPDDYIRTIIPVEFRSLHEPAPVWEKTLGEIFRGEPEKLKYLQRFIGYALTGKANEHVLAMLLGGGRNGKDTIVRAVEKVLGPLAGPVSNDVLIQSTKGNNSGAATPHLMPLRGRRIAIVSETNHDQSFNTAQVKLLTGGGKIAARPMYGSMVEFEPTHTLFLMTNNKPRTSVDDFAFWERVKLIEFNQCFVDNPNPFRRNEHKKNPHLWTELESELSGILAWLVRGCLEYQQHGLAEPTQIRESVAQYRTEEDELGLFIAECCMTEAASGKKLEVQASLLFNAYKSWCETQGRENMSNTAFGRKMGDLFKKTSGRYVLYEGIALVEEPII